MIISRYEAVHYPTQVYSAYIYISLVGACARSNVFRGRVWGDIFELMLTPSLLETPLGDKFFLEVSTGRDFGALKGLS